MTSDPTNDETAIETSDTQLTVSRTFSAPVERVYRAFTDPDELNEWYAPHDMEPEIDSLDLSPGGTLSGSAMAGEDPYDYEAVYSEIVENERLAYTWRWLNPSPPVESTVTIEFRDLDGETEVVVTQAELPGPEGVEDGVEGWKSMFEKLEAVL